MKLALPTKHLLGVAVMAGLVLLTPAALNHSVGISPAQAQVDDGTDDDVPVGGVAAGAGGTYNNGLGTSLPIAATVGGFVLAGAGVAAYRRRK